MLRHLPDPEKAKPCVLVIGDDEAVAWAIAGRVVGTLWFSLSQKRW